MSEYWKSLPRKYCDSCKCWFADNKASLEFHEKGKRHQENVQKRINQIQKKGLKEYKAKKELEDDMMRIEKAALEAFKKDIENNPDLTAQCIASEVSASRTETNVTKTEKTPKAVKKESSVKEESCPSSNVEESAQKIWYEGVSDEGYTYYWNSQTSESQWEAPEGYISLQEQNEQNPDSQDSEEKVEEPKDSSESIEDGDGSSDATCIGPQPKPDPYGRWVTVKKKEEQYIDLELPVMPNDGDEVHIPLPKEEKFKIKEKTVGHLSSSDYGAGESTFKKRKNLGNAKKNARQRLDES